MAAAFKPPSTEEFGFQEADLDTGAHQTRSVPATAVAPTGGANELVYRSVQRFVIDLLLPTYRRKLDGRSMTWCAEWERHPEAVVRLEALWRSWEHLRLDPALGMSIWLRDHLDYHLPILLDARGPFRGCSTDRGHASLSAPALILSSHINTNNGSQD